MKKNFQKAYFIKFKFKQKQLNKFALCIMSQAAEWSRVESSLLCSISILWHTDKNKLTQINFRFQIYTGVMCHITSP